MENKYPVRSFGVNYICDDCKDTAIEYKEFKSESIDGEISYSYIHVCPKCGKEYRLDKQYPHTRFEPITEIEDDEKWWNIFKKK